MRRFLVLAVLSVAGLSLPGCLAVPLAIAGGAALGTDALISNKVKDFNNTIVQADLDGAEALCARAADELMLTVTQRRASSSEVVLDMADPNNDTITVTVKRTPRDGFCSILPDGAKLMGTFRSDATRSEKIAIAFHVKIETYKHSPQPTRESEFGRMSERSPAVPGP